MNTKSKIILIAASVVMLFLIFVYAIGKNELAKEEAQAQPPETVETIASTQPKEPEPDPEPAFDWTTAEVNEENVRTAARIQPIITQDNASYSEWIGTACVFFFAKKCAKSNRPATSEYKAKQRGDSSVKDKEMVFAVIDDLIDSGVDVSRLRKELPPRGYESIRKRAIRVFGSYAQALREYGLYDPLNTPSDVELFRCFEITDSYEVTETYEARYIRELYEMDDVTFRRLSRHYRERTELDALDDFYREQYPLDHLPTALLRDTYPKLYGYLRKHYGTYRAFLKAYKVSYDFALDRDFGGRKSASCGHAFERKLAKILRTVYSDVSYHVKIDDCVPDFIVNEKQWVDAKLSAGSIFDSRSRTLEKYEKYTDSLTVYYARGKRDPFTYGIAEVVHVSTLYGALKRAGRSDLVDDMEAFITALELTKGARAA